MVVAALKLLVWDVVVAVQVAWVGKDVAAVVVNHQWYSARIPDSQVMVEVEARRARLWADKVLCSVCKAMQAVKVDSLVLRALEEDQASPKLLKARIRRGRTLLTHRLRRHHLLHPLLQ